MDFREQEQKALLFIERMTRDAEAVQEEVLSSILLRNRNTEYLQRHGSGALDLDDSSESITGFKNWYRSTLPIITYEDLESDIHRIANGDTSPILSSHPISEFLTSSGTSAGQRKLMPTIAEELDRKCLLYSLLMPVMNQFMTGLDKGKGMYLFFIKSEAKTPGGLLARPVLTSYYKSRNFIERPFDPLNVYTSPNETVLCPDSFQSMYSQLLCGLIQREEVLRMGAVFASGFLRAIRFLEQHWKTLVDDIRSGRVNEAVVTDSAAREAVQRLIKRPDPESADAIEAECCKENWQGIISRLWPNTKYIDVIVTGAMAQYIPTLDFYSGGLPLVCTMYASSECYFGINLKPLSNPSNVSYTLLPNMAYFEFLPVNNSDRDGEISESDHEVQKQNSPPKSKGNLADLVRLVDVKVGREYELVISTYSGLCRYHVGDILRVTGFHNAAPQFAFVCRKNVVLSIDSDKTGEEDLARAVRNASKLIEDSARLVEYTSYADTSTIPGHYVLYWELRASKPVSTEAMEACCLSIEESLDSVYRQGRASDKSIGALEIKVVKPGTFDQLMDYSLSLGASINQYKTPRCVKYKPIVDLLNALVENSYFSPCPPQWSPVRPQWSSAASCSTSASGSSSSSAGISSPSSSSASGPAMAAAAMRQAANCSTGPAAAAATCKATLSC